MDLDRASYDVIWDEVINKEIEKYKSQFAGIRVKVGAKELIWTEYERFNQHCKRLYMKKSVERLDRHKVSAAYIYAVVRAQVLDCDFYDGAEDGYLTLNENLAISVGLSVLCGFIDYKIDNSEKISSERKEELKALISSGIVFPKCNHGSYRENLVNELHYTYYEGSYNLLCLADKLFLLEVYSLQLKDESLNDTSI